LWLKTSRTVAADAFVGVVVAAAIVDGGDAVGSHEGADDVVGERVTGRRRRSTSGAV
jgi:hypothetical protein